MSCLHHNRLRPTDRKLSKRSGWLFAVLSLGTFVGCGHQAPVATQAQVEKPVEVSVASPVIQSIDYTVEQPGRIEPFEQTPIFTKIPGFVREVRVEIGARVKKGDLLVELDVPELVEADRAKQALVNQARLAVIQAERAIDVVEAGLATNRADVDVAQAAHEKAEATLKRWQSENARMDQLVKDKVVDNQSRDEIVSQSRSAAAAERETAARIRGTQATLAETRAKVAKTRADLDAAKNQLTVTIAQEREAQAMLAYSRLTAPYDGVISDRRVHTGHFLNAGGGGTKGEPLLVIVRTDKVRVFVEVPESDAVRVVQGSPGRIRVQTLNDQEFEGTVTGTSWSLDATQRTLRTEIDFANPQGILRPGMYVHSMVQIKHPQAWMIPASAIVVRDGVTFCYEFRDGKSHRLPTRLGLRDSQLVEIAKIQLPPRTPGAAPSWVNPTGRETIITTKCGELIDNQTVQPAPRHQISTRSAGSTKEHKG